MTIQHQRITATTQWLRTQCVAAITRNTEHSRQTIADKLGWDRARVDRLLNDPELLTFPELACLSLAAQVPLEIRAANPETEQEHKPTLLDLKAEVLQAQDRYERRLAKDHAAELAALRAKIDQLTGAES